MQQVEPRVQDWTSRGNNLNLCLPPALEENCISHIPLVPTDLQLAAACGISRLPVSPENITRGAWSHGVLQVGRAGERFTPEGTRLSPRKLLPLLVIASVLFFSWLPLTCWVPLWHSNSCYRQYRNRPYMQTQEFTVSVIEILTV